MDTIDLHLNIQNSLESTLEKTEKTMRSFNTLLENSVKSFDKLDKTGDKLVDHYDDIKETKEKIVKSTHRWGEGLKSVFGTISRMIPGFTTLFSGAYILDTLKATMSLDKTMRDLSFTMGAAGKTTQQLKDATFAVAQATGIAVEQAGELIVRLTELRVPTEMVGRLATNTARFMEITGASADTVSTLTGELVRTGRMSEQATTNMLAGIVDVQRAFGLTSREVESLSDGIIYSTKMLNQMGKNSAQIEKFNTGVVKLSAAFVQVGLEASTAARFIEDLLDPGRIEDNAFLYAKLGVSLEDAFSGNVDPALLASRFKDLGQELKNMTGPAAAAMARQLNMGVGELRQMADMDLSELEKTFGGGADGAERLAEAHEEQLSAQDKLEKMMNRMKTQFVELADKVMPIITKAVDFLSGLFKQMGPLVIVGIIAAFTLFRKSIEGIRQRFLSVAVDTKESIQVGIEEAMDMGSRAGAEKMRRNVSGLSVDRQARVEASPDFARMTDKADFFDQLAESPVHGAMAKMSSNTADWLRQISHGARPLSMLEAITAETNKKIAERGKMHEHDRQIRKDAFKAREQELNFEAEKLQKRLEYIALSGDTSANVLKEEKMLRNDLDKIISETGKTKIELDRINAEEGRYYGDYLKTLSHEQLQNLKLQEEQKQAIIESDIRANKENEDAIRKQAETIQAQMEWKERHGELEPMLRAEYEAQLEQLGKQNEMIQQNLETRDKEWKAIQSQIDLIDSSRDSIIDTSPESFAQKKSYMQRLGEFMGAQARNAGSAFTTAVDKTRASFADMVTNIRERLSPANIAASLRTRGGGGRGSLIRGIAGTAGDAVGGMGRALGGIAKIGGPILLIAGLLSKMEPVQKAIQNIMDRVRPFLEKMAQKLAPVIQSLIDAIMPLAEGLIAMLMPVIERLIGALLPIIVGLMPLIVKLVEFLLPPLIFTLGLLIAGIGWLIEAMGNMGKYMLELPERINFWLPPFLGGGGGKGSFSPSAALQSNPIYQAMDMVAVAGREMKESGVDLMRTAFDKPELSSSDIADGVEEGMTRAEQTPAELRASERGIQVMSRGDTVHVNEERTADSTERAAINTEETAEGVRDLKEAVVSNAEEEKELMRRMVATQEDTNRELRDLISVLRRRN